MPLTKQELQQLLPVLKKLLHSNCAGRQCLLEDAPEPLVRCLSECAHNFLEGNLPPVKKQQSRLEKVKGKLKRIADPVIPCKRKRKLLQKGAGFIGPLISLALPILFRLVSQQ